MLSLLDILFPDATMKLVKTLPHENYSTINQPLGQKRKYNGWADWTTWNVHCGLTTKKAFTTLQKNVMTT